MLEEIVPQVSQEVKTVILIVQYHSSGRYLRSKGEIIEVQEDDGSARAPRNGFTDPDAAGRYLEAKGYQFVPSESNWIDTVGFRRKRKQVFRREVIV